MTQSRVMISAAVAELLKVDVSADVSWYGPEPQKASTTQERSG